LARKTVDERLQVLALASIRLACRASSSARSARCFSNDE